MKKPNKLLIVFLLLYLLVMSTVVSADYQPALWIMDDLNITQVPGGDYSHAGTYNFDVKGVNNRNIKAPFDCTIVAIFNTQTSMANTVIIQSNQEVEYADGRHGYMSMAFGHDNDISDCYVGRVLSQGTIFYQNGNYGNVTGIHTHVTVIEGKYTDHPGWEQVSTGNWTFKNGMDPRNALFITDSTKIYQTLGMEFRKYPSAGALDVNGILDGKAWGATGNTEAIYGTFDVYIDNIKVADDQWDWVHEYPAGTAYRITDIKPRDGFAFDGQQDSYSGTIKAGETSEVVLVFNSIYLVVNGVLDGKPNDSLGNYGTFDVVITTLNSSSTVANDVNSFRQRMKYWSDFEISDIKAKEGYEYVGLTTGEYSNFGKFTHGGTWTVTLAFNTRPAEPTEEWTESSVLPSNITTENCDIEYNNHYEKTSTTSPGSGWSRKGAGTTKYEPTGEYREQPYPLNASNTLVLVDNYYYHWCNKNILRIDWKQSDSYPNYHYAGTLDQFTIESTGLDDDPNITWYALRHKGQFDNGIAWCNDHVTNKFYRMYKYEVRQAVVYYTWVKDSGWVSAPDSNANSVSYRYRLKTVKPTSVSLNRTSATVEIDNSLTLTATVSPTNASNKKVTWSSSNPGIAEVSSNGVVTAKASGSATITATAEGNTSVKATCQITVPAKKPTGISLNHTSVSIEKGKQLTLIATVTPTDAGNKNVTWSSSKENVATVVNGIVTAKAVGSTVITATASGNTSLQATCTVNVTAPAVTDVTVNPSSAIMQKNQQQTLTATVLPADAGNKNVTWNSSNESVAAVSNGVVTAKAAGTAVITAYSVSNPEIKGVCTVSVIESAVDNQGKLTVGSASAKPGSEVTLGVSFSENPGFLAIALMINYDQSRLEFTGYEDSGLTDWSGTTTLVWIGNNDTTFNGEIVKLKFRILENAAEGDAFVTVVCNKGDIGDSNENEFIPAIEAGKVTVRKYMPGDMNGDGKVNAMDLIRLKRFLGGESVTLEANGDVTNDGKINAMDLIRLKRYLGGEAVNIY